MRKGIGEIVANALSYFLNGRYNRYLARMRRNDDARLTVYPLSQPLTLCTRTYTISIAA